MPPTGRILHTRPCDAGCRLAKQSARWREDGGRILCLDLAGVCRNSWNGRESRGRCGTGLAVRNIEDFAAAISVGTGDSGDSAAGGWLVPARVATETLDNGEGGYKPAERGQLGEEAAAAVAMVDVGETTIGATTSGATTSGATTSGASS